MSILELPNIPKGLLKPCPFCAASSHYFAEVDTYKWVAVKCGCCGATGEETRRSIGDNDYIEEAYQNWNNRASLPLSKEAIDYCARKATEELYIRLGLKHYNDKVIEEFKKYISDEQTRKFYKLFFENIEFVKFIKEL